MIVFLTTAFYLIVMLIFIDFKRKYMNEIYTYVQTGFEYSP